MELRGKITNDTFCNKSRVAGVCELKYRRCGLPDFGMVYAAICFRRKGFGGDKFCKSIPCALGCETRQLYMATKI